MRDALADRPAPEVRVLSSELLVQGAVWDIRRDRFRYGDDELTRDYMDHPGAVAVFALDAHDRVCLIQQYRHAIAYRDWEIPAGLMDVPGEAGLAAAQRELAEEADLAADRWDLLLDTYTSPGGQSEAMRIFLARELREVPHDFVREGEEADMETRWVPLDDLVAAALDGRVQNGITVSAALAAIVQRERGWQGLRDPHTPWERRDAVRGERSR